MKSNYLVSDLKFAFMVKLSNMKRGLKIILILSFLLVIPKTSTICQNFQRYYKWNSGDPIGYGYNQQIPSGSSILASSQTVINFSVRFADSDEAVCDLGAFSRQFPFPKYRVTFESNSPLALFQNSEQSISGLAFQIATAKEYKLFTSQIAILRISQAWIGDPKLEITATVEDLSGPLPIGDSGSPIDSNKKFKWSIGFSNICPVTLGHAFVDDGYQNAPRTFEYIGMPEQPPTYKNIVLTEQLSNPISGGLFTWDDILQVWKGQHPAIINADQAAFEIFRMPSPGSFVLDKKNKFKDTHDGFGVTDIPTLQSIFTADALANDRVGYLINQSYFCGNTNLGNTMIFRRLTNSIDEDNQQILINKIHQF